MRENCRSTLLLVGESAALGRCLGLVSGVASCLLFAWPVQAAAASCNTRAGFVANQPSSDVAEARQPISAQVDPVLVARASTPMAAPAVDEQTLKLDPAQDLDTLTGIAGRYTRGVPVLGVRLENVPGFDGEKHCNAIQPILYKPRLERLGDGRVRATVEDGRFAITIDPRFLSEQWVQDPDVSGRFFWIFLPQFGASNLPAITRRYDAAFQREPRGSVTRRWIAEAYLNLAFRYYRLRKLNLGMPAGWRPRRSDLRGSFLAEVGKDCTPTDVSLICLASETIERNETAPPGDLLSPAAFMVGDALLENSGVSTGVRQLDFGTSNSQAKRLAPALFPNVAGMSRAGVAYRRPIRTWDIDTQNRWFRVDGPAANAALSRDDVKRLLLASHALFLKTATQDWTRTISRSYPTWSAQEQLALAVVAIDLENVSGYRLRLTPDARSLCGVLSDATITGKRSNAGVARNQAGRLSTARVVLSRIPATVLLDWSCIRRDLTGPSPANATLQPISPAAPQPQPASATREPARDAGAAAAAAAAAAELGSKTGDHP